MFAQIKKTDENLEVYFFVWSKHNQVNEILRNVYRLPVIDTNQDIEQQLYARATDILKYCKDYRIQRAFRESVISVAGKISFHEFPAPDEDKELLIAEISLVLGDNEYCCFDFMDFLDKAVFKTDIETGLRNLLIQDPHYILYTPLPIEGETIPDIFDIPLYYKVNENKLYCNCEKFYNILRMQSDVYKNVTFKVVCNNENDPIEPEEVVGSILICFKQFERALVIMKELIAQNWENGFKYSISKYFTWVTDNEDYFFDCEASPYKLLVERFPQIFDTINILNGLNMCVYPVERKHEE